MNLDQQAEWHQKIVDSWGTAADVLALEDIDDADDEEYDTIYNDRNHCAVCQVKTVVLVMWPAVRGYINELEQEIGLELTGDPEA